MKLKIGTLFIVALVFLISCHKNLQKRTASTYVIGLNSVIVLGQETTSVVVRDFVIDPSKLDEVNVDTTLLSVQLSEDKEEIILRPKEGMPALANLELVVDGVSSSILLKKSDKVVIPISFTDESGKVEKVQVKGDFNAWNPNASTFSKEGNVYSTELLLSPGQYQYVLMIDGKETLDPSNPNQIDNNIGGINSLLIIPDEKKKAPKLSTGYIEDGTFSIFTENDIDGLFVYWENHRIPVKDLVALDDFIKVTIPDEAKEIKRTHIRAYAYNEFGVSNDLLVPIEHGKVLSNANDVDRFDKRAQIIYFLMVDRFMNGNPENDQPLNSPEVLPIADYHGGDLEGVIQKVKDGYFEDLGVNTIWLSPITQNPLGAFGLWKNPRTNFSGYHGYWPISSSKVDFRFGTGKDLHQLINGAHEKNMNVILDYVANHVHEEHPVYQLHPDWATDLYLPDGTLNTEKWDEHRLTTWFDTFLPTLDLSKPEVIDAMTDSALIWLTEFPLDGFRHDATKHIPEEFWRTLTLKIKQEVEHPWYQIGETYGSRELISSYIGSGMIDGQFDFNTYDDAVATFARDEVSFKRLSTSLAETRKYYGVHNLMGYITGNQDRARFISYAGGQVRFDEDAKAAGWTRDIGVGDPSAYDKSLQLISFNMTIPGVPCIYYGDEIGMPGGNDPDNRRMMRFEDDRSTNEKELFKQVKKVIHARKEHLSLVYGGFNELILEDDLWVYTRKYFNEEAFVIFSKSDHPSEIQLPVRKELSNKNSKSILGTKYNIENNSLNLTLPANGVEIIIFE